MQFDVRIYSLLIGYAAGMFLTAELVARRYAGKSASEIGATGNPGMANIMANLGFKPGILVLIGDLGKCLLAVLAARLLFPEEASAAALYAGLGCTLGHDFPVWRRFRGGKGVAASSMAMVCYSFLWGLIANIAGMLCVFATKYLCLGGVLIPLCFAVIMGCLRNTEAAVVGIIYMLLALYCHRQTLMGIRSGRTKKDDVLGGIIRRLRGKNTSGKTG